jgi:tetratricopeptide (TPR) repeat protein
MTQHQIYAIIYLSTADDLEFIKKAIRLYMDSMEDRNKIDLRIGVNLVRLLYTLDRIDEALKILKDPEMQSLIRNSSQSMLIIMNKLAMNKDYAKVIELFNEYYSIDLNAASPTIATNGADESMQLSRYENNNRQPINRRQPISRDHLQILIESLLYMNTKESHDLMRKYLEICENSKCFLDFHTIACCFLLSLRQVRSIFFYYLSIHFYFHLIPQQQQQ